MSDVWPQGAAKRRGHRKGDEVKRKQRREEGKKGTGKRGWKRKKFTAQETGNPEKSRGIPRHVGDSHPCACPLLIAQ
jgi:hypothetical protein